MSASRLVGSICRHSDIYLIFFVFLPVFGLVLVCNALRHRQRPSIHRARQTWLHVCFGLLSLYWSQIMNMNS